MRIILEGCQAVQADLEKIQSVCLEHLDREENLEKKAIEAIPDFLVICFLGNCFLTSRHLIAIKYLGSPGHPGIAGEKGSPGMPGDKGDRGYPGERGTKVTLEDFL